MSGLMVNSHEGRKPSSSWTRPLGRPRRTWLNLVQEDANAIHLYGELRSSGVMGRRNGPSGLRDNHDDDDSARSPLRSRSHDLPLPLNRFSGPLRSILLPLRSRALSQSTSRFEHRLVEGPPYTSKLPSW